MWEVEDFLSLEIEDDSDKSSKIIESAALIPGYLTGSLDPAIFLESLFESGEIEPRDFLDRQFLIIKNACTLLGI